MHKFFNHILVPVNFNRNTSMVMEKAIAVANYFDCDIHVLHVHTSVLSIPFLYDGHFTGHTNDEQEDVSSIKMNALLSGAKPALKSGLRMESTIVSGNWYAQTKDLIISKHIDLVIVPCHQERFFGALTDMIDINQLSQQTQCPVMIVNEQFDIGHLQHIVVPIDTFLPIRKLSAATCLAQKFDGVIHLMGYRRSSEAENNKNTSCLTRSYQLLRDYAKVKVYCSSRNGNALAEDTLAYARDVNADLIVVNSGNESRLKGWFNRWIGKYLYGESNIALLIIAPNKL